MRPAKETSRADVGACERCGKAAFATRLLQKYSNRTLGIPGAVLVNSVDETYCTSCDARHSIAIPNLEGLLRAAAVARVKYPMKLNGEGVRFLRTAAGWSATKLAKMLGVRKETVSRWENDREVIGETSEKLLRMIIGVNLAATAPGVDFDARDITKMEIQPVQSAQTRPVLHMERVKVPRRSAPAWADVEDAA